LSPSATVGSLGATELLLTTLSPSRAGRLIEAATESDGVGAILASISLVGTELELLTNIAGFLFFGYAVYEFLPRLFPKELAVVTDRRGYRIFAVCFALVASETIAIAFLSDVGVSSGVVWGAVLNRGRARRS